MLHNSSPRARRTLLAAIVTYAVGAPAALANVGTGLSLDQYQAGTENTNNTIVSNGRFENVTGATPTGWTQQGSFQVGAPTGANTGNNGVRSAQGPLGAADPAAPAFNGYSQTVAVTPNTNYILSGYLWNFGLDFDLSVVELRDPADAFVANIALTRMQPAAQDPNITLDGSRGVFGFKSFNSGANSSLNVVVKFDTDETVAGARPSIAGQIDNVAITPTTQFAPPLPIPEPTAMSLAAAAGLLVARRRSR